ncbi:hypothetical protein RUM44_008133 [Polyplax serrata]|uniref:Uncharacterized protein n=1 Tax=Polyplax serrata TaxID=468196 RepID=A0ABR1B7R1_POLSC
MKLSNNTKYCFHFTWMGGNFNNRTFRNIQNKTCSQYFKDKKTLCINPMVATYTGGEPDTEYILEHHATAATCRVSQEQVCAKYTVYHNGIVSYQTRYCTQINIDLEGAMQTGCIQEKRGNELIQVCACTSEPGPSGICNAAFQSFSFDLTSVLILCTIYLLCVYI